jgi:hypothetical protein
MKIPSSCYVGNTLFKKLFYENASMNAKDKDIFKDHIKKITWEYSFKPNTINIQPYKDDEREYEEVALIAVDLEEDSKYKRIAAIIQKTVPYPLILVMKYDNRVIVNVAHKRINKNDEMKDTVEELIFTEWIDSEHLEEREISFIESIELNSLSYSNFYRFYCDFVDRINKYNASQYSEEIYAKDMESGQLKLITDEIEEIEKQILSLRSNLKKEKHFNKKMKLNIEIKKIEEKKVKLIEKLK